MAWLTKNSATIAIDRRPEPYLDEATKAELEKNLLPKYPTRRAAALPLLHAIQDKHGWIPAQAIEEAAAFLGIAPSELADTASFYEMYWTKPKGEYLIMVCQSISCALMGHHKLMEKVTDKLGIGAGQTTPDGKFTLIHAECLGTCCGGAPCALVNDKLHEDLTPENLDRVLDALP